MRFSVIVAGLVGILASVAVAKDQIHAHGTAVRRGPAYPDLQARLDKSSGDLKIRGGPSRTRRSKVHLKRTGPLADSIRTRAAAVLNGFRGSLQPHAGAITSLCNGAPARADAQTFVNIASQIKVHLDAIISLSVEAVVGLRNCHNGPVPSQRPSNPPSTEGVCTIIVQILLIIHGCCTAVVKLCIRQRIVAGICSNALGTISAHLQDLVNTANRVIAGEVLGNIRAGLGGAFDLSSFGFGPLHAMVQ